MHPFQRRSLTWTGALAALVEAEFVQERAFASDASRAGGPVWTPPVDLLETESEILVVTAMPGVDADAIEIAIDDNVLMISGCRQMPHELNSALIHRLELPQGRFVRRIALPPGRYATARRANVNNCVVIRLSKSS